MRRNFLLTCGKVCHPFVANVLLLLKSSAKHGFLAIKCVYFMCFILWACISKFIFFTSIWTIYKPHWYSSFENVTESYPVLLFWSSLDRNYSWDIVFLGDETQSGLGEYYLSFQWCNHQSQTLQLPFQVTPRGMYIYFYKLM